MNQKAVSDIPFLNSSFSAGTDRVTNEKHQLFTRIIFTVWVFLIIYSGVYFFLGAYLAALVSFFTAAVLVPMTYVLDRKKYHTAARLLCVISAMFVITFSSIGLDGRTNTAYYFLPSIMFSLLFFELHQKRAILLSIFLPLVGWTLMKTLSVPTFLQVYIPSEFPFDFFSNMNFVGAYGITFIFLGLFAASLRRLNRIALEHEHKLGLAAKMASLGELAGGIAHEINNPLAIVVARTQLLKEMMEDAKNGTFDEAACRQNLDKIEETSALITKIVRGLSSFSRNSDQDPLQVYEFNKIVEFTLELCHERLIKENIQFKIAYNADALVNCRESQIAQVMMNLIANALDAIEDVPEKWIDISVSASPTTVKFVITDSGKGIPPEVAKKIMQPFFSTKRAGKGIGLGLSISKGIVEAHNGKLRYDDSVSNTRFILELPRIS